MWGGQQRGKSAFVWLIILILMSPVSLLAERLFLAQILKKCASYCELLSNSVFHFVCLEEVEERLFYSARQITYYRPTAFFQTPQTPL